MEMGEDRYGTKYYNISIIDVCTKRAQRRRRKPVTVLVKKERLYRGGDILRTEE